MKKRKREKTRTQKNSNFVHYPCLAINLDRIQDTFPRLCNLVSMWKIGWKTCATTSKKEGRGAIGEISVRADVIEKPIPRLRSIALRPQGETSLIRLMNRSLYRLAPVKNDRLRVLSNLSTGANRPRT